MIFNTKIFVPKFISSVTSAPARVLPHIYFYNGQTNCEAWFIEGYSGSATTSSATIVTQSVTAFPQLDYYSQQQVDSSSLSLLFNNEFTPYGTIPSQSLYSEYWETYVSLLYDPQTRLVACSAIIPLADYFKMNLNDVVEWRGNYYYLRAINDYNTANGECNLQLLGPILDDTLTITQITSTTTSTTSTSTTSTTTGGPTTTTTSGPTTTSTTSTSTTSTSTTTTTIAPLECNQYSIATAGSSTYGYVDCYGSFRQIILSNETGYVCASDTPFLLAGVEATITNLGTCTPSTTTSTTSTSTTSTSTTQAPTTTTTTTAAPTTTSTTTQAPTTTTSTTTIGPTTTSTSTTTIGPTTTSTSTTIAPTSTSTTTLSNSCISASGGITGTFISGLTQYKYHMFTASADFTVISGNRNDAQIMVVAGGGAGGLGGGGGAGGVNYSAANYISTGTYNITVGTGGIPATIYVSPSSSFAVSYPTNGTTSSVSSSNFILSANGGGYGGTQYRSGISIPTKWNQFATEASVGGAGGGASGDAASSAVFKIGANGIEGYKGSNFGGANYPYGGGGGYSSAAQFNTELGGNGIELGTTMLGVATTYAGGGAGVNRTTGNVAGGGGNAHQNGTPNTGGGGGGGYFNNAGTGAGGSGIVIITYPTCAVITTTSTSTSTTTLPPTTTTTTIAPGTCITYRATNNGGGTTAVTYVNCYNISGSINIGGGTYEQFCAKYNTPQSLGDVTFTILSGCTPAPTTTTSTTSTTTSGPTTTSTSTTSTSTSTSTSTTTSAPTTTSTTTIGWISHIIYNTLEASCDSISSNYTVYTFNHSGPIVNGVFVYSSQSFGSVIADLNAFEIGQTYSFGTDGTGLVFYQFNCPGLTSTTTSTTSTTSTSTTSTSTTSTSTTSTSTTSTTTGGPTTTSTTTIAEWTGYNLFPVYGGTCDRAGDDIVAYKYFSGGSIVNGDTLYATQNLNDELATGYFSDGGFRYEVNTGIVSNKTACPAPPSSTTTTTNACPDPLGITEISASGPSIVPSGSTQNYVLYAAGATPTLGSATLPQTYIITVTGSLAPFTPITWIVSSSLQPKTYPISVTWQGGLSSQNNVGLYGVNCGIYENQYYLGVTTT